MDNDTAALRENAMSIPSWFLSTSTASILIVLVTPARADITTYMDAWDRLPEAQISQGTNVDCGLNRIVYDQPMVSGFRQSWPGSGDQGEDICWRRTSDPLNANSGLTDYWTRCASSSSLLCEIR